MLASGSGGAVGRRCWEAGKGTCHAGGMYPWQQWLPLRACHTLPSPPASPALLGPSPHPPPHLFEHKGALLQLPHRAHFQPQPLPLCLLLNRPWRPGNRAEGQLATAVALRRRAGRRLEQRACSAEGATPRQARDGQARTSKREVGQAGCRAYAQFHTACAAPTPLPRLHPFSLSNSMMHACMPHAMLCCRIGLQMGMQHHCRAATSGCTADGFVDAPPPHPTPPPPPSPPVSWSSNSSPSSRLLCGGGRSR